MLIQRSLFYLIGLFGRPSKGCKRPILFCTSLKSLAAAALRLRLSLRSEQNSVRFRSFMTRRTSLIILLLSVKLVAQPANPLLEKAIDYYHAAAYQKAADALQTVIGSASHPLHLAKAYCYLGEVRYIEREEEAARLAFEKANTFAKKGSSCLDTISFYYLVLQGLAASGANIQQEKEYALQLINYVASQSPPNLNAQGDAYYGMGVVAIRSSQFSEALAWVEKAIAAYQQATTQEGIAEAFLCCAFLHYSNRDYYQAVIHQKLGLQMLSPKNAALYFMQMNNLAAYYFYNRDIADARAVLERAKDFGRENVPSSSPDWAMYYEVEQEIFNELGWLDSLAHSLDEAAAYYVANPAQQTSSEYSVFLNFQAALAYRQGDYNLATQTIQKYKKVYDSINTDDSSIRYLESKILAANQNLEAAVYQIHQLLIPYDLSKDPLAAKQDPNYIFSAAQLQPNALAITYLKDKAAYFSIWNKQTGKEELLYKSNECIALADQLITKAKAQNNQPGFRRQLDEISLELRKVSIENYFRLYQQQANEHYLLEALNASEQVKYLATSEKLHQTLLSRNMGLPKQLLDEKRHLDSLLYAYHRKVNWQDIPIQDQQQSRQSIDSLFRRQDQIQEAIQSQYPRFAALMYQPSSLQLHHIRRQLIDEDEALLHFLEIDNLLYVIGISQEALLFKRLQPQKDIRLSCLNLADEMQNRSPAVFQQLHYFYQEIMEPLADFIGQKHLVIVPDGHLWYVPFSALLQQAPSLEKPTNTYAYLIQDRDIRYLFNLSVAKLQKDLKKQAFTSRETKEWTVLGLSPLQDSAIGSFQQLSNPRTNASAFNAWIPADQLKYLENEAANLHNFRQYAPKAELLHLFTHAAVVSDQPDSTYLVFNANRSTVAAVQQLSFMEVLNSRLEAQLLVLGACRTGNGQLRRGVGVINLARAFSHAGCENMIVNLWDANDEVIDQVLASFYERIFLQQETNSHAINAAQRQYLQQATLGGHPSYWATTIYIGENSRFKSLSPNYYYAAFPLALLVTFLLILWRIKGRK